MGYRHKDNNATFNMWVSVSQSQARIETPGTNGSQAWSHMG